MFIVKLAHRFTIISFHILIHNHGVVLGGFFNKFSTMTHIKYFSFLIITCFLLIILSQSVVAQKNKKNDAQKIAFKNMVDSQHFVFQAQTVTPLRGNFRNLTSLYDVRVTKDSLISYLPYFGQAYTAPIDQTKSSLDFTSASFSYSVSPHKKDGWNITIKPKDKSQIQQYIFTVFNNGKASLSIISTSKDQISFNGYIREN